MNKIKPLTIEETSLKEEMKSRCLNKGQYIDEKAKDKFEMLCHLEDFEVQYWELKDRIDKAINLLCDADSCIMKREYAKANRRISKAKDLLKGDKE